MTSNDALAMIERQEEALVFDGFGEADAWRLGCRLRELSAEQGAPVVVDIRRFDRQLFFAALPGSVPDNAEWVRRKGNVVRRFHRSSYGVGLRLKRDGATIEGKYGLAAADYAAHGGSFPIAVRGAGVIGSVTVSGLPQRDDHALVVRALCETLGKPAEAFALA